MFEAIFNAPAILKIITSLAAIIIINKLISNQIYGVLAGTLILAVWSGHSLTGALSIAWTRFSETDNIFLMIVVLIVIFLSAQMKETGIMDDLVSSITRRFSRNKSMAILPAVIGLLPMPGGAVFSAPLVDSCDPFDHMDPSLKSRINYWFRHIWEYWWPLYPGVLLAIEISGLPVPVFMVFMLPVSLFSILGAWFFLLRKTENDIEPDKSGRSRSFGHFLFLVSPIIIVMGSYAVLGPLFPALSRFTRYLPITIGILLSIIYLQIMSPSSPQYGKKYSFPDVILIWWSL